MDGNMSEWVADWPGAYPDGPVTDPIGAPSGTAHIARGATYDKIAALARVSTRLTWRPLDARLVDFGPRCARDVAR